MTKFALSIFALAAFAAPDIANAETIEDVCKAALDACFPSQE